MPTLHVKTVTPRVVLNRTRKVQILSWSRFEAALKQVTREYPEAIRGIPRIFWINQLNLWNKHHRGSDIHAFTYKAAEHAARFPMGH